MTCAEEQIDRGHDDHGFPRYRHEVHLQPVSLLRQIIIWAYLRTRSSEASTILMCLGVRVHVISPTICMCRQPQMATLGKAAYVNATKFMC